MAAFAAVENVFPPVPATRSSRWAAGSPRAGREPLWAFLATWDRQRAGASAMYFVGRRHWTAWIERRFPAIADEKNERRCGAARQVRRGVAVSEPLHSRRSCARAAVRRRAAPPAVTSLASIAVASGSGTVS
jgi:hypothetical protein